MSKRLGAKLALTVFTLGLATLLQGCGDDDDRVYWYSPYMPCMPGVTLGPAGGGAVSGTQGATSGQDSSAGGTGGASNAARSAGGGNQTSGGGY